MDYIGEDSGGSNWE